MSAYSDEELNSLREKYGVGIYNGYTMSITFENIREDIENFEVFDDDIWVCGFPKSGTSWTQEMVWCISNNLDFQSAKKPMETRYCHLEQSCVINLDGVNDRPDLLLNSVDVVKNMKRPRFIKSHLPWELLPKQITSFEKRPKIINVVRNPMDTFVSLYYFIKMLGVYNNNMELLAENFLENKIMYTPYDDNVLSYWDQRNQPNVLFLKYEDMKHNLPSVIDSMAEFFGKTLPESGKDQLISHLSFESLKDKKTIEPVNIIEFSQKRYGTYDKEGKFMRSGKSGGYRHEMSEDAINRFKRQFMDTFEKRGIEFLI